MKRRTKIATILTTGLLSAALVGVGFAAWTIGSDAAKATDVTSGDVKAETVTQTGGLTAFEAKFTEDKLNLGGKPSDYNNNGWAKFSNDGDVDDDDTTLTLEITGIGKLESLTLELTDEKNSGIESALTTAGLSWQIKEVKTTSISEGSVTKGSDNKSFEITTATLTKDSKITVTIEFVYTGGHPYTQYGCKDSSKYIQNSAAFEAAMTKLATFANAHSTLVFTVTPTAGE